MAAFIDNPPDENTREPYPQKWLRKQFTNASVVRTDAEARVAESSVSIAELNDWMPLHWLLNERQPRISDILTLLDEVGQLAFAADVSPLSVADPQIVRALIEYNPECISTADKDGAYALMYAAAWNESELTFHALHQRHPEAVRKIDKFGFNALHYASYVGCSDVVSYLLQVFPEALKLRTLSGVLPLQAIVINNRPDNMKSVAMILNLYPEVILTSFNFTVL